MRLAHAMTYFLYDSLPFDYISSISGFNKEITFFRFKTMTDMTPQTYLNQMLNDGKDGRIYRGTIMSETLISTISYLYENMSEPIDAKSITQDLYISKNILRIQFKSTLDSSYKEILSQFRVRYAEALLTTTNLPIMDIAIESGFGSDRTMTRVFFSINGISPGEFRKQRHLAEQNEKETHK
jgi:AraC-like DNA-binding protein